MKTILTPLLYLLLIITLSKSEEIKEHFQRQFRLKSFGSLTSAYKVLFSGDGGSFPAALRVCTEFCRGDRRCIGMEVCQIREDLYRCRACCEWMKLGEKTEPTNNMTTCKYYEMEENTNNIAVGMNGSLSSIYHNDTVSNAVDNVIECTNHLLTAHTLDELQPWLKIDLQAIYDVKKVIIYNRQDCCGDRLHDVQVNITNNGPEASCGFYEGPADDGDRIAVYCAFGAVGRYVLITILNPPEEKDPLNICEVQVFVDV